MTLKDLINKNLKVTISKDKKTATLSYSCEYANTIKCGGIRKEAKK